MPLSPPDLQRVSDLFERKGWRRSDAGQGPVYDRLCHALGELTGEARELLFELTRGFLWCDANRNVELASELAERLEGHIARNALDVVVVGMIKPCDFDKPKSAGMATYLFRPFLDEVAKRHNRAVTHVYRPDGMPEAKDRSTGQLVIIVDDYVGSGRTAEIVLTYMEARSLRKDDVVVIASLVMQHAAVAAIGSRVHDCVCVERRGRGIADAPLSLDRAKAYEVMKQVEDAIPVGIGNRFGYAQSEALVCMYRCPNNTFPFFWHLGPHGSTPRTAPFQR